METTEQTIKLDDIIVDNNLNPREGALDQEAVLEYSQAVEELPPMHVFSVPGEGYLLVAGFHRIAAHRLAGADKGRFVVHEGDRAEAHEFADMDNLKHGLRLTRQEKRAVIGRYLRRHPERSDVWVAKDCHTTDKTVRSVRQVLEEFSEIPTLDKLVDVNGIERPRSAPRPPAPPEPGPEVKPPLPEPMVSEPGPPPPPAPYAPQHSTASSGPASESEPERPGVSDVTWSEDGITATVEVTNGDVAGGMAAVMEAEAPAPPEPKAEPEPPPPPPPPPSVSDPDWVFTVTIKPAGAAIMTLRRGMDQVAMRGSSLSELVQDFGDLLQQHVVSPPAGNGNEAEKKQAESYPEWLA